MRAGVLIFLFLIGTPAIGQQPKEIINSIGMKMVLILPGSFTIGLWPTVRPSIESCIVQRLASYVARSLVRTNAT